VTTALTQRAHLLQEENDELYELLKHSETGKLKDEARGLRRVVAKLEVALNGVLPFPETQLSYTEKVSRTESHQIISSLSYVLRTTTRFFLSANPLATERSLTSHMN